MNFHTGTAIDDVFPTHNYRYSVNSVSKTLGMLGLSPVLGETGEEVAFGIWNYFRHRKLLKTQEAGV